jgi:hypothetical protein
VLYWNAANGWITVRHLGESGDLDRGVNVNPLSVLEWLGGQAGVLSPLVFLAVLGVAFRAPGALRGTREWRYGLALFLPLFVGYTLLSFNRPSNANWAALAYPCMLVLVAGAWERMEPTRGLLRFKAAALWTGGVLTGIVLLAPLVLRLDSVPIHRAPFNRVLGFPSAAAQVDDLRKQHGAEVVISSDRSVASLLAFYLPDHPRTFIPSHTGIRNQFSLWPGYAEMPAGTRALLVTIEKRGEFPEILREEFTSITDLGTITSQFDSRPVRTYRIYLAEGLRPTAQR